MTTKGLDLASLDTGAACDKGAEIELQHPITRAPLGVFISVVGKDGKTFRDYVKRVADDRLRRQAVASRRGKEAEIQTVAEMEADSIDLLVACTTGWRNVEFRGAKDWPFSADNARTLYTELRWIRDQVDEAVGDLELFFTS